LFAPTTLALFATQTAASTTVYGWDNCRDRLVCFQCCRRPKKNLLRTYKDALQHQPHAFFVTISLSLEQHQTQRLQFIDTTQSVPRPKRAHDRDVRAHVPLDNAAMINTFFQACHLRVKSFSDSRKKYINGAIGRAELTVRYERDQMLGMPHLHFIFFSDDFRKDDARVLLTDISETIFSPAFPRLGAWMRQQGVYVSLRCLRLMGSKALRTRLYYLIKPIDFVKPYEFAVSGGDNVGAINAAFKNLISDLPIVFHGRPERIVRWGVCSPTSRRYIGTPPLKPRAAKKPRNVIKFPPVPFPDDVLSPPDKELKTEDAILSALMSDALLLWKRPHFLEHVAVVDDRPVLKSDLLPGTQTVACCPA
jgi:hypothetical protein